MTRGPIDYERMQRVFPRQRAQVRRLVEAKDVEELKLVVVEIVDVWNEIGSWPDDWTFLQRALDDVLPWNRQVLLEDLIAPGSPERRALQDAGRIKKPQAPRRTLTIDLDTGEWVGQGQSIQGEDGVRVAAAALPAWPQEEIAKAYAAWMNADPSHGGVQ